MDPKVVLGILAFHSAMDLINKSMANAYNTLNALDLEKVSQTLKSLEERDEEVTEEDLPDGVTMEEFDESREFTRALIETAKRVKEDLTAMDKFNPEKKNKKPDFEIRLNS